MRLLLACILALLPFSVWADSPSTSTTDGFDQQTVADPADPNEAETAVDQQSDIDTLSLDQLWPYGNPYSPSSPTNFQALIAVPVYEHGQLSPQSYAYEPEWLNDPFGHYGSRYSLDLMNRRYHVDNPYSPDSPMHVYTRGGQAERRER